MAALLARWASPTPVAAACPSTRPVRGTLHVRPRCPSPPALVRIGIRPRGASLSRCQMGHPEHEPEPELEREDGRPAGASSEKKVRSFRERLEKYREEYCRNVLGVRAIPEMFGKEKDEVFDNMMKTNLSKPDILNVHTNKIARVVCQIALVSLTLASKVMDMSSLGLGTTELSPDTTNQTVRMYARTFCKAAEHACHNKIQMETILSFLGALGGLGAIAHILVQDTVAILKDGPSKNEITRQLDADYHEFNKKMNVLKEEFTIIGRTDLPKIVDEVLWNGFRHTKSYISKLIENALPHDEGKTFL